MRALTARDAVEIGGHRLLARLGAGGMGVVYLARTSGGQLVALKVVRAEYAADPAFRARFRREARLAAQVRGRWAVPVTGADPQAREPWLATAFVPGPTLAEAVAASGALPLAAVLGLGRCLGDALAGLHTAGLVHRDVKPGNIVLGRDGPHLIDFGIARAEGITALTAPGAVIGTPGYLSPEQTRAHDDVGPASDVFSLGCVLAYAASGRPPFGGGDPAAVLYRTVHEDPDLTGLDRLPATARTAVARCLSKDPAHRPTAAELRDALTDVRDPRLALTGGEAGRAEEDWLPPAVLRLVAAHSARALDPPAREAAPAEEDGERSGPSRRRFLAVGASAGGVLAAGGIGAAALALRGGGTGGGGGERPVRTIGLQAVGTEQERGARLAVAAHNSRADAPFRLALRAVADPSADAARRLAAHPAVRAVLGPATDAAAVEAGKVYANARMAMVLVSAHTPPMNLELGELVRYVCGTRVGEDALAAHVSIHLTRAADAHRTAVVEDGAGGSRAAETTRVLRLVPPGVGTLTVHQVAAGEADFGPAVRAALATRPDAVVYAGLSPVRAAACARALADRGFTGPRAALEPVLRETFLDAAGDAAGGWVIAASHTEVQSLRTGPARAFTAAYRRRYGALPGRWAAEAYDAVALIARVLRDFGDRSADVAPGQIADRLFRTPLDGVVKPLRFETDGYGLDADTPGFLYGVSAGRFRFLGRHDEVTRPFAG
ncbi:bifunctional serine/threonine-protein kinase/ABC transporter substrate-binding protein [Streptomyces sp. enrichment culture]|uniref:bifunctional serine/threonine-protein kinase/ABC transporter substrate-binding protein n=1 Tax=Streptomyces sp. enrichment culture TaxID=1795815 RepID=UPI003F5501D5